MLLAGLQIVAGVLLWLLTAGGFARAVTLELHNPTGGVHIWVSPEPRLRVEGLGSTRKATQDDIKTIRHESRIVVRCEPADGESIDLDVQMPLGFFLDVTTEGGAIAVDGMVRRADLRTKTGDILLTAPWQATRIRLDADSKPAQVSTPRGVKFSQESIEVTKDRKIWRLEDNLDRRDITYGDFRVKVQTSGRVSLNDFAIPNDWPIKFPWHAPPILDSILAGEIGNPPPKPQISEPSPGAPLEEGTPVFRSDVRMVNFALTVQDENGRPVAGLQSEDFTVVEAGEPQQVTFAGSDDVPFNLAILLDLSGSTRPDREAMLQVAERFISLAKPIDKIGVYALAGGMFHVVSRLTADREQLLETIRRLPSVSGASPLYDTIVLAYGEELRWRHGERNALIIISDGIDNQISKQEAPSRVKFTKLVKAAAEMEALIYPIFLRSGERFGRGWAEKAWRNMDRLANASGGRLFPALSAQDLDPVLPAVAQEIRSVYSVAYYPKNQGFGGEWRNVEVKVNRPGVTVRCRAGYFAR